jgi:light-regulated signal transduction histidine kinase (bacteriophytochrome)
LQAAPVQGNKVLLARMVTNIIDNAVRHNEPNGWIRVVTDNGGTSARLIVETGGQVLDERQVRDLAQPFRRIGAERTGSDNGVGLAFQSWQPSQPPTTARFPSRLEMAAACESPSPCRSPLNPPRLEY